MEKLKTGGKKPSQKNLDLRRASRMIMPTPSSRCLIFVKKYPSEGREKKIFFGIKDSAKIVIPSFQLLSTLVGIENSRIRNRFSIFTMLPSYLRVSRNICIFYCLLHGTINDTLTQTRKRDTWRLVYRVVQSSKKICCGNPSDQISSGSIPVFHFSRKNFTSSAGK